MNKLITTGLAAFVLAVTSPAGFAAPQTATKIKSAQAQPVALLLPAVQAAREAARRMPAPKLGK